MPANIVFWQANPLLWSVTIRGKHSLMSPDTWWPGPQLVNSLWLPRGNLTFCLRVSMATIMSCVCNHCIMVAAGSELGLADHARFHGHCNNNKRLILYNPSSFGQCNRNFVLNAARTKVQIMILYFWQLFLSIRSLSVFYRIRQYLTILDSRIIIWIYIKES